MSAPEISAVDAQPPRPKARTPTRTLPAMMCRRIDSSALPGAAGSGRQANRQGSAESAALILPMHSVILPIILLISVVHPAPP